MSSLTRPAPLSPFELESSASVFRRLLLRVAVLAGLASTVLVWNIGPVVVAVGCIVGTAMLTAIAPRKHRGRGQAWGVGVSTARVSGTVVAAIAVTDLAGLRGVMLVVICVLLSDRIRGDAARAIHRAVDRVHVGS